MLRTIEMEEDLETVISREQLRPKEIDPRSQR